MSKTAKTNTANSETADSKPARSQAEKSAAQDAVTRERIQNDLKKNFIVEAAAGTGKTTSLVNRMVALVQTGTCRIDQLAAVTFTRKAAAELRERFQAALRKKSTDGGQIEPAERDRLTAAADNVDQAFVGTIHSFCATLLRERPIEFGVDPAFRELDEKDDRLLREQAWHANIADLIASGDPLLDQLRDLDIDRSQLKSCFDPFIENRDIENWPTSIPAKIDLESLQNATRDYIDQMRQLAPFFPADRKTDKLMDRYEKIIRAASRSFTSQGKFFSLLAMFDSSPKATFKYWPDAAVKVKDLGKREEKRWSDFRSSCASPGMIYWTRYRYQFVVDFLRRAVRIYERLKRANGGLDFQDLLLTVAKGLKDQSNLRTYFQGRFTHLLVDEFQDTDPLQAQMMLYLTANAPSQSDWTRCVPRSGSLFLVGDPKQSIYRFRRGDIITYNRVKEIITQNDGEVLALVKNFRSQASLIDWNNAIYREKFGAKATVYSPAAEDMVSGREDALIPDDPSKTLSGTYRLELPTDLRIDEVCSIEAESIARFIRHAIDTQMQVSRTEKEKERGISTDVRPQDFLIIPWGKKRMEIYTEALERYGIPYQVSGGNPLSNSQHLYCLLDCLRAIDDPTNPVHYLAVLRNYFGFSDRDLFLLKQAGGSLNYNLPIPENLEPVLSQRFSDVSQRFARYQSWMRTKPYATAASEIALDLGVFASAAATDEGNMQVGGLFKIIESLRSHSWNFDSATDLIQFLEEVLKASDTDACPALPPDNNVVRLMNLHKAKGLEAPIVFLADTAQRYSGEVRCHIDRSDETPLGYMGISARTAKWKTAEVAAPENWKSHQEEEQKFLDAEHDRNLYVATTRAACVTIVSVGKDKANWSSLIPYLKDSPALEIPADSSDQANRMVPTNVDFSQKTVEQIDKKWKQSLTPGYIRTSAKKLGLKGKTRPNWQASGDYGHQWGTVVHALLEIHYKSPLADLRPVALQLIDEFGLQTDRVNELLTTVNSVTNSKIWKRSQKAKQCFSELPFEITIKAEGNKPELVRGVIDLIFEETDGWVIVDYKTDDISLDQVESATEYYRSQLQTYAEFWTKITGQPTKELVLVFTKTGSECSVGTV